jgi:5'-3' exonuclease
MLTIIDADGIPYIIAYKFRYYTDTSNHVYTRAVIEAVDDFLNSLFKAIGTTEYAGYLSNGEKSFRYQLARYKKYKGTRSSNEENGYEVWAETIINHMVKNWMFRLTPEGSFLETDDVASVVAREHMKTREDVLICSADKDLLQVPCKHFNFAKWDRGIIQATELGDLLEYKKGKDKKYSGHGFKFLMYQMIAGDQVDNIMGIKGKGPTHAYKILKDCDSKLCCVKAVLKSYLDWVDSYYGKMIFREMYSLLKLLETSEYVTDFSTIPYKL